MLLYTSRMVLQLMDVSPGEIYRMLNGNDSLGSLGFITNACFRYNACFSRSLGVKLWVSV